MDHFAFMGLPMSFRIDEAALRRAFLMNSKKYHPDFFGLESSEARTEAEAMTAKNNEAFKVLSDEMARIEHVLQQKGLLSAEANRNERLRADFLAEMMELNETLSELVTVDDRQQAETQIEAIENELRQEVEPIMASWSEAIDETGPLEAVKEFFLKRKYLLRLRERLSTFAAPLDERL